VKGVLGKELAGTRPASSGELAEVILDHADVAVVPGEAFGTPGYFRLSYALSDADLEEGVTRLGKLLAEAR
jgi:aspartate/methionine/tyrosine aminotransferase